MYYAYFFCCEDLYDIQPSWNDRRTFIFFLSKHKLFAVWVSDWFRGISLYTDFEFWISMLACLTLLSSYSNIPHAKLLEYSYIQPSLYYFLDRKFQCLTNYLQYNIQKFHFLKLFFTNSIRIRENVLWRTEKCHNHITS